MILFAHRGAPLTRREQNTLPAFERALSLGADGVESDVLLTADGVPVLAHTGLSLSGPRISRLRREQLPPDIPSLADVYERCGSDFDLALDMSAPAAADAVVSTAERYGADHRLWLTYWRLPAIEMWRARWPSLHLVYAGMPLTRRRAERLTERLAAHRVDALNVHSLFCSRRLAERTHEAGLRLFVWGVGRERSVRRAITFGADGVFCDNIPALAQVGSPLSH